MQFRHVIKPVPKLVPMTVTISPAQSTPISPIGAWFFFGLAVSIFGLSVLHFVYGPWRPGISIKKHSQSLSTALMGRAAANPDHLLIRSPAITINGQHFSILGLGQRQMAQSSLATPTVWIRDLQNNQIGSFAAGEPLFSSRVVLHAISPTRVSLRFGKQHHNLLLPLDYAPKRPLL